MPYLVLARKYRPQTFEAVIQQDHVTRTLQNAIVSGRVAHAILFAGPRGTGKTTVARIMAKAMNCREGPTGTPCNTCTSCLEITAGNSVDVFEIDGASNNSVDQVRELRENVKYMPARSPYKIYIIDEVHMLSLSAFNALLKTLEEPPSHVLFFFATTEPNKIPITILSRCQRHDFRRIDARAISEHMQTICEQEGVAADPEGLWLIAREAQGCMRDALSLLDQIMSGLTGALSRSEILELLGFIDRQIVFELSDALLARDVGRILEVIDGVYHRGLDMKKLHADLVQHFRNLLILKMGQHPEKLMDLPAHEIERMRQQVADVSSGILDQLLEMVYREESAIRYSAQPKLVMEMLGIRLARMTPALPINDLIEKIDLLRSDAAGRVQTPEKPDTPVPEGSETGSDIPAPGQRQDRSEPPGPQTPVDPAAAPDEVWERFLAHLSASHPALAASLSKATLTSMDDKVLEIELDDNGFNWSMIRKSKNRDILEAASAAVFGDRRRVVVRTGGRRAEARSAKKKASEQMKRDALSHPLVTAALDIFNGKVVDVKLLKPD
ncbi:DNA polymerase III subunits gamma and tau (EC [Olavius algarvensis associated proteobacterium Delta 3]|nr:DNA polymerase III subunits gamma and tau (EC [Olavius algarvensis associated proteobacterium Delta 3]